MAKTKLYNAWANMKKRVKHPTKRDGENYKNISYTSEWEKFEPFKKWALENGYEEGLSLDRIDVYGDYEPSNCRWITMEEQQRNKTTNKLITYNGKTQCIVEWEDELGFKRGTLKSRLLRGWSVERAFNEPLGLGRKTALEKRKRDERGKLT